MSLNYSKSSLLEEDGILKILIRPFLLEVAKTCSLGLSAKVFMSSFSCCNTEITWLVCNSINDTLLSFRASAYYPYCMTVKAPPVKDGPYYLSYFKCFVSLRLVPGSILLLFCSMVVLLFMISSGTAISSYSGSTS